MRTRTGKRLSIRLAALASAPMLFGLVGCELDAHASDVNADGWVDAHDVEIVGACLGLPPGAASGFCARADVQADGDIDAQDLAVVQNHLGTRLFTPSTVPYEPASVHIDADGVLYLHAPDQDGIHRWSMADVKPLSPIHLEPNSNHVVYSPADRGLYVGYFRNELIRIDPRFPDAPALFAMLPTAPQALAPAGPYLFAKLIGPSGGYSHHVTLAPDGTLVSLQLASWKSRGYAFSADHARMYYFNHWSGPHDLRWDDIDPETGAITGSGQHSEYGFSTKEPPIWPSPDSTRILVGTGELLDGASFDGVASLPAPPTDALWLENGELVTLVEDEGTTLLQHRRADLSLYNAQRHPGRPIAIRAWATGGAVVTLVDERPAIHAYDPAEDGDGDGVAPGVDDFPLDAAASVDTDGDGHPDAWNPGYGPEDSTEGLVLDAFPDDPTCQLPEHAWPGDPTRCDVGRSIPPYEPSIVEADAAGTIYLLSPDTDRVYRWSMAGGYHLEPIEVGDAPHYMAHSQENGRLYLGYAGTAITQIDLGAASPGEQPFASTPETLRGIQTAGPFLLSVDISGNWETHRTFAPNGAPISARDWNHHSPDGLRFAAATGRMFYTRGGSPKDLHYEMIDASTGAITSLGESPYHNAYAIKGPIRISPDGAHVLLGSGDIYDGTSLEVTGALPIEPADALWLDDGSVITLRALAGHTRLEHWNAALEPASYRDYPGLPRRVLRSIGQIAVVTQIDGRPVVQSYVPSDDTDGDGVANSEDAFPLDPAASQDSDGDGYPDAWNPGYGPEESIEGLVLDAFPLDSACQLPEQASPGSPGACDVAAQVPDYVPTHVEIDTEGVVYLLSPEHDRIFRWSALEGEPLNPIVVGDGATAMTGSAAHDCLYVGYANGTITRIDLAAAHPKQSPFTTLQNAIRALQAADPNLLVSDATQSDSHYSYGADGHRISTRLGENNGASTFAWSVVRSRAYFTTLGSPQDIRWHALAASGAITGSGESAYHGEFWYPNPLRVSPDGALVLVGTGYLFDAVGLEIRGTLPHSVTDATWPEEALYTLRPDADFGSRLERWNADRTLHDVAVFPGEPLRALAWSGGIVVTTSEGGQPSFHLYTAGSDGDGDGVAYDEDSFPLDPAASQDGDRDGAPDAWNPGYGPEDSREQLVLDAFPDDAACQLAEHGFGGVCDTQGVLPETLAEAFCDSDDDAPAAGSGSRVAGASADFVPLCNGWILSGDGDAERLVARNLVTGRTGASFGLPAAPRDLELDEAAKLVYAALPDRRGVAVLDLLGGAVRVVPFDGPVDTLASGPSGVFVTLARDGGYSITRRLYWLPHGAAAPVGGWTIVGRHVRWNYARSELVIANQDASPYFVQRHSFTPETGPSLIQQVTGNGRYGRSLDLSPDGSRVAWRFDSGVLLADAEDLAASAVLSAAGSFAFDPATARYLEGASTVTSRDLVTHAPEQVFDVPACFGSSGSGAASEVAYSRGGALAFVLQSCDWWDVDTVQHWFASPH